MTFEIKHPTDIPIHPEDFAFWKMFLQQMTNRRAVGSLRYGNEKRKSTFMTRLGKEFKAYKKDGNMEQLLNIAVYAFLEANNPENKKFHFDNTVDSVTRK